MVMERSNCLVSLQACLNLNAIGIELSLLLFEAGLHSGLDCRILPVHPRVRAEKKETRFLALLGKSVFYTSVTWQWQDEARCALRHTERAMADVILSER